MHQNHLTKGNLVWWNTVPAVIEVWWWHPAHSYTWRLCSNQPLWWPQHSQWKPSGHLRFIRVRRQRFSSEKCCCHSQKLVTSACMAALQVISSEIGFFNLWQVHSHVIKNVRKFNFARLIIESFYRLSFFNHKIRNFPCR